MLVKTRKSAILLSVFGVISFVFTSVQRPNWSRQARDPLAAHSQPGEGLAGR